LNSLTAVGINALEQRLCFTSLGQMFGSPREPRTQQFLQRIGSAHRL
jgi:hypothetical protein